MRHFLAYGNSDQASFRNSEVLATFDYITVPGTIASYYSDATAAFVLTSQKPYMIDPRTPLLQGDVSRPKASHLTLATWLGEEVERLVKSASDTPLLIDPQFFNESTTQSMTRSLVTMQRAYGERAGNIENKLERYRRLRVEAQGLTYEPGEAASSTAPSPAFLLAPYFASSGEEDPWWRVNMAIWEVCKQEFDAMVSPVAAVTSPAFLERAMNSLPEGLSETAFYWVTGLDEHRASQEVLETVAQAVKQGAVAKNWVNLYGGFFSICLSFAGLWGFNNGLGYSESRRWPDLATTGAAPPRYYIRRLHAFMPPATAQLVVDADDYFACSCSVCHSIPGRILQLTYGEMKQHFALARAWELDLVAQESSASVANELSDARRHFMETVATRIPATLVPDLRFLDTWSAALLHS